MNYKRDSFVRGKHSFRKLDKLSDIGMNYELPVDAKWYSYSYDFVKNLIDNYNARITPRKVAHWASEIYYNIYNLNIILTNYKNPQSAVQVKVDFKNKRIESKNNLVCASILLELIDGPEFTGELDYVELKKADELLVTQCIGNASLQWATKIRKYKILGKYKNDKLVSVVML